MRGQVRWQISKILISFPKNLSDNAFLFSVVRDFRHFVRVLVLLKRRHLSKHYSVEVRQQVLVAADKSLLYYLFHIFGPLVRLNTAIRVFKRMA